MGTQPAKTNTPPLCDWAREIRRVWAEGGANTLSMAGVVAAARAQLKRDWSDFWRTVPGLPFHKSKANMLVRVARLTGLSEQTFVHLPRGWSILYHLARLEPELIGRLVDEGVVHPELTLAEAKRLVRRRGKAAPLCRNLPPVKARVRKFAAFVNSTLPEWSASQRQFADDNISKILSEIRRKPDTAMKSTSSQNAGVPSTPPSNLQFRA
jgi:hypothetical protein